MDSTLERMRKTSHLAAGNFSYMESMYDRWLANPGEVPQEWRSYFERLPNVDGFGGADVRHSTVIAHFERLGKNRFKARPESVSTDLSDDHNRKQAVVSELIAAYRQYGHEEAKIDPLGLMPRRRIPELDPLSNPSLGAADLDDVFQVGSFHYGEEVATLREFVKALRDTYCGSIGLEYMHIVSLDEVSWLEQRIESSRARLKLDDEAKLHILERLTAAEGLETYLHNRYPGTKRFGLDGCESFIPLLDHALQRVGASGAVECVIGMAHRGRLNVLVNILGKQPSDLFDEFEGKSVAALGSGDVKYHLGFSADVHTPGGTLHLALSFNPSHLEIVAPVVVGSVRARQDRRGDHQGQQVVPINVHGDAAFAGQGVVMECFQMSQTRGYRCGGSLHVILNNQIGFTTGDRQDARSTEYCSEVAKIIQAPIFHVNADDPEAVLLVTELAVDYRMKYMKDVVIDLVGYRRHGHNEAEDPTKTQPVMYKRIRQLPTVRASYAQRLIGEGVVGEADVQKMSSAYREALASGKHVALSLSSEPDPSLFVNWAPYIGATYDEKVDTRFDEARLRKLALRLEQVPEGFEVHKQVRSVLDDRHRMAAGARPANWGFAEIMAYATLIDEGVPVRLTGQDVAVGTFSHRHARLFNQKDGSAFTPLEELRSDVSFDLYNSLLSEEAVLACEYGYAATTPTSLVVWEAQFGDFANGAQVVIDQFISSGELKWGRLCGLVMLLPHGYDGSGPEHSSARLERYLQLCAQDNMMLVFPSTPAQVFHMFRRHMKVATRRPLIVMSAKNLLRFREAVSFIDELTQGGFQTVLPDPYKLDPSSVNRIVLCSGKVYYDLSSKRHELGLSNVDILRIEQLFPFPEQALSKELGTYKCLEKIIWCQEEPRNQGAWFSSRHRIERSIAALGRDLPLQYVGREPSAAAACGYLSRHIEEQRALVRQALGVDEC